VGGGAGSRGRTKIRRKRGNKDKIKSNTVFLKVKMNEKKSTMNKISNC